MKYKIDYLDKNDRIRHKIINAEDIFDAKKKCVEWTKKREAKLIETHEILHIQQISQKHL